MFNIIKFFALALLVMMLAGCIDPAINNVDNGGTISDSDLDDSSDSGDLSAYKQVIESELKSAGVSVTNVDVEENNIEVSYSQPISDEFEEIYATWAYIFGVCVQNAPVGDALNKEARIVSIVCSFDDGEKMRLTASFEEILNFLNEETSTWEFIYSLEIEPLTQGPPIPE